MLLDIETIGLSVKEAQKKNMEIIPDAKFGFAAKMSLCSFHLSIQYKSKQDKYKYGKGN